MRPWQWYDGGVKPERVMTIYDISVPINNRMVSWPGDPGVRVERVLELAQGDPATVSHLSMGSHTGTHVDAFSHFKREGKPLDAMDLSIYVGEAVVVEIADPKRITARELSGFDWTGVERVLFKTRNSSREWYNEPFDESFVHISPDGADFLIEKGIRLVGIDYLSVEGYHADGAPCHHRLMDHGIYIVEGLYLKNIQPGRYELICLPLKVEDGDGAPARVVLRDLRKGTR